MGGSPHPHRPLFSLSSCRENVGGWASTAGESRFWWRFCSRENHMLRRKKRYNCALRIPLAAKKKGGACIGQGTREPEAMRPHRSGW